jgi:alpha-galactosidase
MKVDEYGILKHIWYGENTSNDMEYLLDYPDIGFSGNLYEAENRRTYSTDTLPLEYSCNGTGDFRISAIAVQHSDGSNALDLRFESYAIKEGKYSIQGMPSVYDEGNQAQTLEITLKDTASGVKVVLKYGVFSSLDIITRSVVVVNTGEETIKLTKAHSMCLDFPYGDFEWIHFYGRHTMERQFERTPLIHGIQESSSKRGTSSHHQNPTMILCEKDCSETNGSCVGAMLVYSGSFQTKVEYDQQNQTRITMGISDDSFAWNLKPNEEFYTPEVVLSYSGKGLERLTHNFHRIVRHNICRGKYKLIERPVLINNWEATYFDFNEEQLYNIAKKSAELGVDMFVMDDGWFGKRDSDNSGLGDWFVNEDKLKGGLKPLVDKVTALGMKFGIWFEPEMVSEDSDLYRTHPDWAIQIPNRKPNRSRYQLVLDMTRNDVRDYLFSVIYDILNSADISYVKWDMNRSICDWYSNGLDSNSQGEMAHRYVLGLYDLLERLTTAFPNVLFEGCSGGGGRFDAGILAYCPQIWCSDDTDAFLRTKIQYGTSYFYPTSTVGSHVSCVPNHQSGRVTSMEARSVTAMAGSFGYELDLNKVSDEEKAQVKEDIKRFKEYGSLIHNGDYYRLSDTMHDNYSVWQYVSEDKSKVLVQGIVYQSRSNTIRYNIKLRGLDENKKYKLSGTEEIYTGRALMCGGILLPKEWGDYFPIEFYFTEV